MSAQYVHNGNGDVLLVGGASAGEALSRHLDEREFARCDDPYDALEAMGRRRWASIVLTAPQAEFAALCRASRRLQSDSRLFAVCSPAAEPQTRRLMGSVLDDYFIYPPTARDVAEIRRAGSGSAGIAGADLSAELFARLVESARSRADLEARLAAAVRERLGAEVFWTDEGEMPDDADAPLLRVHRSSRVLVPRRLTNGLDESSRTFLTALQRVLPALTAAATRTESLHRLAITDYLTGAYNRRYFYHATDRVLLRAGRDRLRATLLLYDIDDFKHYNDTCGHAAGDEILRQTALLMKQTTRSQDIVARIGGDEFAVLFWDDDRPRSPDSQPVEDIHELADRFRNAVATMEFPSLGPDAKGVLTISGGLAKFPEGGRSCRELLRTADKALRRAKENGKNSIVLVGHE